ncbi:MAG: hypothetical protein HZC23_16010 [Rhodocyclales bacterium]|nr:hypothetical protein [Rhodocyclales bacterium]
MDLTAVEAAVLDWIAKNTKSKELMEQLASVKAVDREYTGAGSYTTLQTSGFRSFEQALQHGPVDGPWFQSPGMEGPACSLLWLEGGVVKCLELAGFRDPQEVEGFWFLDTNQA